MDTISLLKRLTEAAGISGFEKAIRDEVTALWSPLADEIQSDTLGNVIAIQRGNGAAPRPKLMLAGHMDEIGLMVTRIRRGFLSITALGGVDRRLILGQPVLVHGRRDLPGVVGSRPPHLLGKTERGKLVSWDDLVVDVGLPAEEVAELVRIGDLISFRQPLRELIDGRVTAKALDDRVSLAAIAICLELLQSRAHVWDVVAVATVQEEETFGGAITSTYRLQPDVAIAIDATFAEGGGVSGPEAFPLDKGPTIGYGPNNHPGVHQALVDAARAIELPYHIEPMPRSSGTDAWAMQVVRAGVPTGVVLIPIRNMHMPVELVAVKDVERAGRLLAEFAARLDADFVDQKLAWDQEPEGEVAK
jgi:putative aminopeptidase FrvX